MVTYFNARDMVSFGRYLLSDERRELYANHPNPSMREHLEDRLKEVNHADFDQWKSYVDTANKIKKAKKDFDALDKSKLPEHKQSIHSAVKPHLDRLIESIEIMKYAEE